ncbi:uncharacterized protein LOC144989369 isoform X2 [Oryzias latipes]
MASTTFLGIILLLVSAQVFMSGDHSVKDLPVVLGTSGVLRPDDAVTSIISITWRHDGRVVANWFGGNPEFYLQCIGRCSLNTTTGELTINHVTLEDRGVYTPEINGSVLPALVLFPKPTNPEETSLSLNSTFNRTDVFKTPDDRRVNGTEDSKEETFVSSLNNSVLLPKTNSSSDTSHYYTYYLLTVGLPVGLSVLIVVGLVWIFCCKGHQKISRNEPRTSAGESSVMK